MLVFKDEEQNTFYAKTYYTDYTGAKKQKMKRGFLPCGVGEPDHSKKEPLIYGSLSEFCSN